MNRRGLKEASRQCLRDAAYSTKKVTLAFLAAVIVLALLEWGAGLLVDRMGAGGRYLSDSVAASGRNYLILFLVSLVVQLVTVLLSLGYTDFSLRLSRKEDFDLSVLWSGFSLWTKAILLYLYTSVLLSLWASVFSIPVTYVLAALYAAGTIGEELLYGLMFLYMGIVMFVVSYRYRMAWYVLLDNPELSVRQIISRAKAINQVHRWQLFLLDLSFLPWMLLCVLTCGILLVWKLPYITATYAHAYNWMLEDYARRQKRLEELLEQQRLRQRPM